ncbi:hypothetical protein DMUE_0348 [Dictyocoela muelleri]|nr:hypothetical protein DMUE_0348 [Dictyocoela muelleri]
MPINQFNWESRLDNIIFQYNNTKHRATHCKPFILFKGFDINISSGVLYNTENNIQSVKLRLMEYVDSYRREYNIRQFDNIMLGSKVLVAKPYSLNNSRKKKTRI